MEETGKPLHLLSADLGQIEDNRTKNTLCKSKYDATKCLNLKIIIMLIIVCSTIVVNSVL